MNKSYIKNGDNSFLVSTDTGEQILYETNNNTSNEEINEILLKENEIECLEKELWNLGCQKSDLRVKDGIAKIMYYGYLPVSVILGLIIQVANNGLAFLPIISTCGGIAALLTIYNISITGTFMGRKKKTAKLEQEINETEVELAKERKLIDKLKHNATFVEIEENSIQKVKPIDRTYEPEEVKALTKKLTKN